MKSNVIQDLSQEAKDFLKKHKQLPVYDIQEDILKRLLKSYPDHTVYEAVAIKAKLLNSFYSTGIQAIDAMVDNIMCIGNIDALLSHPKAEAKLVHAIANLSLSDGSVRDNYSFATKYCALHQPKKYPIYDSIVAAIFTKLMQDGKLPPYQYKRKSSDVSTEFYLTKQEFEAKLRNYESFIKIYDCFRRNYGLTGLSYREVDWYLWGSFKDGSVKTSIEKLAPIPESKYQEIKVTHMIVKKNI